MTASLRVQTNDSVWNQLCFSAQLADSPTVAVKERLAEHLFLRGFIAWRQAGRSEVSGSGGAQRSRRVPPGPVGQAEAFQLLGTLVVDSHQGAVLLC